MQFRTLEAKKLNSLIGRLNSTTQPTHLNLLAMNAILHLVEHGNNKPLNHLNKAVKNLKISAVYTRWMQSLNLPVKKASDGFLSLDKKKLKSFEFRGIKSFTSFLASEENEKLNSAIKAELNNHDLAAAKKAVAAAELSGDEAAIEEANNRLNHLEKVAVKKVSVNALTNQLKRALASQKTHGLEGNSQQLAELADLASSLATAAKIAASTQQGVEANQIDGEAIKRLAASGSSKTNARVG